MNLSKLGDCRTYTDGVDEKQDLLGQSPRPGCPNYPGRLRHANRVR
jgi:hypothetical protein